jgi:hypothetical protein
MVKNKIKPGAVVHDHNPSCSRGGGRRIVAGSHLSKSTKSYLKNKLKSKGLREQLK